jgi:VWFA-related protein
MPLDSKLRLLLLFCCAVLCAAQTPEMTSQESQPTFTMRSNLVLVRVVVRDKKGQVNGSLLKEDFQLFDKGKPQVISKFSVEKSGGSKAVAPSASPTAPGEKTAGEPPPPIPPERYVVFVFDDLHLRFEDLSQARTAAEQHLAESLGTNSRAAIFTTSEHTALDFTDDIAKLKDAMLRIQPANGSKGGKACPNIGYYQADLIRNREVAQALAAALQDTFACASLDPKTMTNVATTMVQSEAARVLAEASHNTQVALQSLHDVIRRISTMPGQRNVVLVSPGFLLFDHRFDVLEIADRAIRANVTINTLDARGLYTFVPGGDATQQSGGDITTLNLRDQYQKASAISEGDVLAELADSTGGTWIHDNNDLAGGFRRLTAPPDYYYILGFAPENLKFDGSYHSLKVSLKNRAGLSLQARRGYFAPKHAADPAQEAKQEIEETLFSGDESLDIPVVVHTQFFKSSDVAAKLSIVARIDVRQLHFRKVDGRNADVLTVVTGLFDRNGEYVNSNEKTLNMNLKDSTLAGQVNSGITVKTPFDVTPGSYFIRIVVRDAEGQRMSALNAAVEIP